VAAVSMYPYSSWFQSLSGFLARCNSMREIRCARAKKFQSLSGFLARCNYAGVHPDDCDECEVSIPVGFSCSLQQDGNDGADGQTILVSIPVGFSCSLQPETGRP